MLSVSLSSFLIALLSLSFSACYSPLCRFQIGQELFLTSNNPRLGAIFSQPANSTKQGFLVRAQQTSSALARVCRLRST
jgi:hypothetical protein